MKTKHYKTLSGLLRQTYFGQMSFTDFHLRRFVHKTAGCVKFTLPEEETDKIYAEIEKMFFRSANGLAKNYDGELYGILSRIGIMPNKVYYCTGQYGISERRTIRKIFCTGR